MGDVIDFKSKEVSVKLDADPQSLLERGIVEFWQKIGGFDLDMHEFDYLTTFLAFSDTCFKEMEEGLIEVHDDGLLTIHPDVFRKMKGIIDGFKTNTPTNDN